jgi:general secretion pathway protein N
MLLTSSAHAAAVTSLAVADPLDVSGAQEARAASPAASAIGAHPAALDQVQVVTAPARPAPVPERALSANPLWAIPLTALSGTRDRPIFSASRRPLPPAVAPAATQAAAAPKPREPERPKFSLVGTVASGDEGIAIFLDQSTREALRLKIGEDYQGWRLRSVQGREAALEKDHRAVILALPQPGAGRLVSEVSDELSPAPATPGSSRRRPDREGR